MGDVTFRIHLSGYFGFDLKVEASSQREAREKALEKFEDIDFEGLDLELKEIYYGGIENAF